MANDRLLSAFHDRKLRVRVIEKDSRNRRLRGLHPLLVLFRVAYETRRYRFPVYMTLGSSRSGLLRDALILLAIPRRRIVAVHLHGGYLNGLVGALDRPLRAIVVVAFRRVDRGLVLCEQLRDQFQTLLPGDRIVVVANGIEPRTLGRPQGLGVSRSEGLRILFLSNSLPSKGLGVLIDALVHVRSSHPGWQLNVYGAWLSEAGEKADAVEAGMRERAESLGANVRFGRAVSDDQVAEALAAADVLVLPTTYSNEGQPLAIIEALVAGLHVVATDHRCIGNMFETSVDGVLLALPPTPSNIAEALEVVALMPPMTEHRRLFHESRWSVGAMTEVVLQALQFHGYPGRN
jgi:glycosyltransferase involved in cell wall biosynthesis